MHARQIGAERSGMLSTPVGLLPSLELASTPRPWLGLSGLPDPGLGAHLDGAD
jgi:hypothetical protein